MIASTGSIECFSRVCILGGGRGEREVEREVEREAEREVEREGERE